jgi:hypothetical protein
MRKSAASAISSPPPNAKPSMQAIVGMGSCSKSVNAERKSRTNWATASGGITARSFKSAPEQKTLGTAELIKSTLAFLDYSSNLFERTLRRDSLNWASRAAPRAFLAVGLFKVSKARPLEKLKSI